MLLLKCLLRQQTDCCELDEQEMEQQENEGEGYSYYKTAFSIYAIINGEEYSFQEDMT